MKDITEKLFAKSNGESIKAHSKKVIDAYIYKVAHRQCGENNAKLIAKANIIMPYSAQYHDIAKGSVVFQEKVGNLEYIKSLGPEGQKELLAAHWHRPRADGAVHVPHPRKCFPHL